MSCAGCLPNEREKQQYLQKLERDVKEIAKAEKTVYIIYEGTAGNYLYMQYKAAAAANITPLKFISYL